MGKAFASICDRSYAYSNIVMGTNMSKKRTPNMNNTHIQTFYICRQPIDENDVESLLPQFFFKGKLSFRSFCGPSKESILLMEQKRGDVYFNLQVHSVHFPDILLGRPCKVRKYSFYVLRVFLLPKNGPYFFANACDDIICIELHTPEV